MIARVTLLTVTLAVVQPVPAQPVAPKGTVAGQPTLHPDAWETDVNACLGVFKQRPRCLTEQFLRVPQRELSTFEPPAVQLTETLKRWLGRDDVAALYRVKDRQLGEWMIVRHFVIESSEGSVRLVRVSFRRILGQWWVHGFRLFDRDEIDRELGLD
ncbi:MAG: hypothetical protein INH41_17155 [Myxococcaceae bacterium]|jgi:hypothetical protein|nr:hypothetical protein [Myxococcaceae bacterium]